MNQSTVHPDNTRIGWIGTGVMGRSMCSHLLKAGYRVAAYNRSSGKVDSLVELGAIRCSTPAEVALQSDVVFSIVGYPKDVRQVILGSDGVLDSLAPGSILVDMTTSQPSLAIEIDAVARGRGIHAMDAPVSGGDVGAREARLSIMVGGEEAIFERLMPIWQLLGTTHVYQGPAGAGHHTKMVNQILIAASMIGLSEALLYAQQSGLDPLRVLQSVSAGAAGSWSLSNLTPRVLRGDFQPGFFVDHFVKDLGIALEEAKRFQLELPGTALAERLYQQLQSMGHGQKGTQSIVFALAERNHIAWNPEPKTK